MLIKTLTAIAIIICPLTNILATENDKPEFVIMGGYSGGVMNVGYDDINDQIEKYHNTSGIKLSFPVGFDGTLIYGRLALNGSIMLGFNNRKWGNIAREQSELSFYRLSNSVKIGIRPSSSRKNIYSPYVGLAKEYLWIVSDIQYGVRCGDCFFQYNHTYSNCNTGFVYGIGYNRPIISKNGAYKNFTFRIDAGGIIAITNNCWKVDEEEGFCPDKFSWIPRFNPGGFVMKIHLAYIFKD